MKAKVLWWAVLGVLAAGLGFGAQAAAVPGGWFVAAVVLALAAGLIRPEHPRVTRRVLIGPQAVIGTMIGVSIRPDTLPNFLHYFPAIVGILVATIGLSLAAGLVLAKIGPLSKETAVLGTLPGGAGVMTMMSLETGADTRVVALMQYLRLIAVVLTASLVAGLLARRHPETAGSLLVRAPAQPHTWIDFALTPLVAALGVWGGRLVRLPTPNLLGPMLLGLLASAFRLFSPVWPVGTQELAYVVMGFYVGLLFDRSSLLGSIRLLPLLLVNTLVLIAACALAGLAFAGLTGADALSGYLATSPGGGDTIAIIALGSGADLSLVFSVQIFRILVIMFTGPFLAKTVLRLTGKRRKQDPPDAGLD